MSTPTQFDHINTSTLIIGATGTGKSTLLATAAEYLWETHQAVSAYYASDLGGYPDRLNALIKAGIVWIFRMRTRGADLTFETIQLASKGYWPATILNPLTGEVPHGVRMIAPTTSIYHQKCLGCGHVRDVAFKSQLGAGNCPGCSKRVVTRETETTKTEIPTPGIDRIRLRLYDGLTSISEAYLQDLSHRTELAGEMGAIGGTVVSGELSFRGNNRSHVGFAQTRVHELVSNTLSIPNQLIMPIFTALANEHTDSSGKLSIIGPKLAGDAKTEIAPAWFGNTLEAAVVPGETEDQKIRRLYLNEYIDGEGRRHILKHRSDPRYMPDYLEDPPYSATEPPTDICTQFSLGVFFEAMANADLKATAAVLEKYKSAPGLANTPTSFGGGEEPKVAGVVEGGTVTAAAPAAAKPPAAKPGLGRRKGAAAPAAPAAPAPSAPAPVVVPVGAPDAEPTAEEAMETAAAVEEPAALVLPPQDAGELELVDPEEPQAAAPVLQAATPVPAPRPAPAAAGWAPPPGARPIPRALPGIRRATPPPAAR